MLVDLTQFPQWLLPGFLCSFFYAVQGIILKILLQKGINKYVATLSIFVFELPFMAGYLYMVGLPEIQPGYYPAFFVSFGINLLAMTCLVIAIEKTDVSIVYIYLGLTPLYILLTGYIILGEFPTITGVVGIILMFLGTYYINIKGNFVSWIDPFRNIWSNRGSVIALLVAALWSVSAPVDKVAVQNSSPIFYMTMFNILFIIAYFPFITGKTRKNLPEIRKVFHILVFLGAISFLMIFFQFHALLLAEVSYIISFKRGGFLFTILFGILIFKEKPGRETFIGSLMMALGLFFLAIA